ncbi:PD40 domain-containing protein [Butyrivibrio sp. XPD2002]|uniref:PD40 domain-containing protein n=1 Tax=Butyrivibrio sp. XPD2002 TaxID=1280665 RepID=UPI00041DC5D8|nr:PD40 domain-containing protein [Butyrivibrio sp. XPD2002]
MICDYILKKKENKNRICGLFVACILVLNLLCPISGLAAYKPGGMIVFHSYSDYNAGDSRIFLYDFKSDTLKCLSENWKDIVNPMNACFRNDGKALVFMGQNRDGEWDIFQYELGADKPVNITEGNDLDDEDPKYDSKGKYIIFKQSNPSGKGTRIVRYSCRSGKTKVILKGSSEKSMPYYSKNGKKIYYTEGKGRKTSIKALDVKSKEISMLYSKDGVQSYYPITGGNGKYLYFSRGYSKKNRVDQIIRYNLKTGKAKSLKCNSRHFDCSDACYVSSKYIIISSTKSGKEGGYDLYLVNVKSGGMTSLSNFNNHINTPMEELGCDYFES